MQLVVNAIRSCDSTSKAVWISTGSPLVRSRLAAIITGREFAPDGELPSSPPQPGIDEKYFEGRLVYLETRSLPRLLALLMHPTSIFPPPSTSVIIVDDLSNIILGSFPRPPRNSNATSVIQRDRLAQRATSRRFQVIENAASALASLAASRQIAVVVLNNATTSLKVGQKAVLKPALSGQAWDAVVNTRIALYRDFSPSEQRNKLTGREKRGYRLAAVVRLGGRDVYSEAVPFHIEDGGLRQITSDPQEDDAAADLEDVGGQMPLVVLRSQPTLPPQIPCSQHETCQSASQRPILEHYKATKRKAVEIDDSEGEDEDEDDDHDDADAGMGNVLGDEEPKLPPLDGSDLLGNPVRNEDEVLFETHERSFVGQ